MTASRPRAVFFDAGNTLIFPRVDQLAEELTAQGYPATVEDFYAAERAGKQKLASWLLPQIESGQIPRMVDLTYWLEYLRALAERIGVPEGARDQVMRRVGERFADVELWSRVLPDTPPFLDSLRGEGYSLAVISNSNGMIEQQLARVDLARRFDFIVDSHVVGVEKPRPEIFHMALERAGVEEDGARPGSRHARLLSKSIISGEAVPRRSAVRRAVRAACGKALTAVIV